MISFHANGGIRRRRQEISLPDENKFGLRGTSAVVPATASLLEKHCERPFRAWPGKTSTVIVTVQDAETEYSGWVVVGL